MKAWQALDSELVLQEISRRLSHDIRGPFNNSIGVLQYLADECENLGVEATKEMILALLSSNMEHQWVIDTLLFWSRLELGAHKPQFEGCQLEEICQGLRAFDPHLDSPSDRHVEKFSISWFKDAHSLISRGFEIGSIDFNPKILVTYEKSVLGLVYNFKDGIDGIDAAKFLSNSLKPNELPQAVGLSQLLFARMLDRMGVSYESDDKNWILGF